MAVAIGVEQSIQRVVFMGTPVFAASGLQALIEQNSAYDVVGVYTQPPRPAKRGKKVQKSPVHELALAHDLPVFTPANFKDPASIAEFEALDVDVAVVAAYGLILPQRVLDAPRYGCVNIHASLLPRWRGAAPIHRAIEAGDETTGICLMQMDKGLDTGDIIMVESLAIAPGDTTPVLHDRLAALGARLLTRLLADYPTGNWPKVAQSAQGVTYAAKIDKAEAQINWHQAAALLARKIRAFVPFPGAYFVLPDTGERIKVLAASASDGGITNKAPGTVLTEGLTVACGEGSTLDIQVAQRAGKAAMPVSELLKGLSIPAGTRLVQSVDER